ncbi:MAG: ABC transporter ATP-binding protein [Advenella sp.]
MKKHFMLNKGWFSGERRTLKAIDGLDLQVYPGETVGLVGESGCGKSTTGNVIMQLLRASEGEIIFDGENLGTLSAHQLREKRKDFQIIFQDPFSSLNPRFNVFELIAEPLRSHGIVRGSALRTQVLELMDNVGLSRSFIDRYPHEFSGGQRQRIGIARALALRPKLIVCDEVVSALDVSIQAQILNLLTQLQEQYKLTYLFISHGLPAVKHISDRIAVMYLGKIVELAPTAELFRSPQHPYTEALLSAVPFPDPLRNRRRRKIVLSEDIPDQVKIPGGCRFSTRCRYATSLCRESEPALVSGANGVSVACHYPLVQSLLSPALSSST